MFWKKKHKPNTVAPQDMKEAIDEAIFYFDTALDFDELNIERPDEEAIRMVLEALVKGDHQLVGGAALQLVEWPNRTAHRALKARYNARALKDETELRLTEINAIICDNVRLFSEHCGYTNETLGAFFFPGALTQTMTYEDYLNGHAFWELHHIVILADLFDCRPQQLLKVNMDGYLPELDAQEIPWRKDIKEGVVTLDRDNEHLRAIVSIIWGRYQAANNQAYKVRGSLMGYLDTSQSAPACHCVLLKGPEEIEGNWLQGRPFSTEWCFKAK